MLQVLVFVGEVLCDDRSFTWIILEWMNEKISTSKQEIQDVVDVSVDANYVPR